MLFFFYTLFLFLSNILQIDCLPSLVDHYLEIASDRMAVVIKALSIKIIFIKNGLNPCVSRSLMLFLNCLKLNINLYRFRHFHIF